MNPGQIANFSTATIETRRQGTAAFLGPGGNIWQLTPLHPGELSSENKADLNKPQDTVDSCSGLPKSLLISLDSWRNMNIDLVLDGAKNYYFISDKEVVVK